MSCDTFSIQNANNLLKGKFIYFFGDSNVRAIYKDLLWLLEDGRLIPEERLKRKNEESHANDVRISNGELHNGCDYDERREYHKDCIIKFEFITRLYRSGFIQTINNLNRNPDIIIINSCVWDLTRWGSTDGVEQFKKNIYETFKFFKETLPSTRIIWLSTLPPAFKSKGGFLTQKIEFMRNMLPWHILYANKYAQEIADSFSIDFLDLHYYFRFLLNYHTPDGIHWESLSVRYITNLILTHICLVSNRVLPEIFSLDANFIQKYKCSDSVLNRSPKRNTKKSHSVSRPLQDISNNRNNRQDHSTRSLNKKNGRISKNNYRQRQRQLMTVMQNISLIRSYNINKSFYRV